MLTHCNANAKIPNFRPSNAAPCKVPPSLPPPPPAAIDYATVPLILPAGFASEKQYCNYQETEVEGNAQTIMLYYLMESKRMMTAYCWEEMEWAIGKLENGMSPETDNQQKYQNQKYMPSKVFTYIFSLYVFIKGNQLDGRMPFLVACNLTSYL